MPNIASLKHHFKHADKPYPFVILLGSVIQTAYTQIYGDETDLLFPKKTLNYILISR
jgi:hypothetical protein